ncbi:MAG: copper chaperone PCu(A)C, partial [Chloroflexota bacterium]|nr:copper chaperone PCu(A)C [Dehalococcoidia bacterium]MDW8045758.1 copper chaperone PCu(A)C [Chloroflexota bacterium]
MNQPRLLFRPLAALLLLAAVPLVLAACGSDDDEAATPTEDAATYTIGDIVIIAPWARANPNPVSGAYMHIENRGTEPDRLVSASCPLAGMTQIHEVVMQGNQSMMQEMKEGLEIPAGGHVDLKPGGYHIMLMDL